MKTKETSNQMGKCEKCGAIQFLSYISCNYNGICNGKVIPLEQSTRKKAMVWWKTQGQGRQNYLTNTYIGEQRFSKSLTGREIEKIWRKEMFAEALKNGLSYLFKNHIYLQKLDCQNLYALKDEIGVNTKSSFVFYSKPETWRYATSDEIAEYNRLGKPFDVTTLNKKSKEELLLEEANKRFPIGSKFKSQLGGFKGCDDTIKIRRNELVYESLTNSISARNERYVYFQGKWAENYEEIPEYVECIDTKYKGEIVKVEDWNHGSYCKVVFPDGTKEQSFKHLLKHSTKEAYKEQNSKKEIEKWSCNTYVVFLKRYGRSDIGYIDKIINTPDKDTLFCEKEGVTWKKETIINWFATYEEAKEFSDKLLSKKDPLKTDPNTNLEISFSNVYLKEDFIMGTDPYKLSVDNTLPKIIQNPLTIEESYPVKELIKTQVISTNIIDIPLKLKKKKQLFTI